MAKTIVVSRGRAAEVPRQNIPHTLRDAQRYGMWCKVMERHSEDHTVDIETAEGFTITRIPVASREWVTLDDPVLGERNLPPVKSMVFMFMPTGGIDNAFIFGSCFLPSLDKHTAEFLQKDKEDEELTQSEGNWKRTFDKVTGDLEIVGTDEDDKTLTITIKKSDKKIQITDWNENDLVVDENGVSQTVKKDYTQTSEGAADIQAEKDIGIQSKTGGLSFKSGADGLLEIGNTVGTLGGILSDLLTALSKLHTEGSPVSHTAAAWAGTDIAPLQAKVPKIFKK
jgi:hypothetical protein